MTAPNAFPLDAEQIVRLAAGVTAEIANALRHPATAPIEAEQVLLRLSGLIGMDLASRRGPMGARMPLPYPAMLTPASPREPSAQQVRGAGDEA